MDEDALKRAQRELGELNRSLRHVRLTVLRLLAGGALAIMALGVCLPMFSESVEDEAYTYRILTIGFTALSDSTFSDADQEFYVVAAFGFLGLLLALATYTISVGFAMLSQTHVSVPDWLRRGSFVLALIGTLVAVLFSFGGSLQDELGSGGGWGPLVTLAGLLMLWSLTQRAAWHDLWLHPPRGDASPRQRR